MKYVIISNNYISGADVSSKMLEYAKRSFSDEERLSFIDLDVETSNLPRSLIHCYDNAFSFYCIHWCKNIR